MNKDCRKWAFDNNIKLFNDLTDVYQTNINMKSGQKVKYTNEFGCSFDLIIIGFGEPTMDGRCVYLDKDSYWFPVKPQSLKVIK